MTQAANDNITRAITIADLNASLDAEPRLLDVTLATALDFKRPADIRTLIARHAVELSRFGEVIRTVRKTSEKGGRPATENWLNKKQALYICTKSETARATEVTIQMVEVYDAYLSGKTVKVQAHERRTSARIDDAIRLRTNIDRLERVAEAMSPRYLTAMVVTGEPVVVDVHDHNVAPNERAVVMRHNGELAIEHVERLDHNPTMFAKPRGAYGPRKPSPYGGTMREAVVIVGRVIERPAGEMRFLDTPAGRDAARLSAPTKQLAAPVQPQVARHKRDVAIRKMAIAGMGNKEIAEVAGVSYWIAARVAGSTRKARNRYAGRAV